MSPMYDFDTKPHGDDVPAPEACNLATRVYALKASPSPALQPGLAIPAQWLTTWVLCGFCSLSLISSPASAQETPDSASEQAITTSHAIGSGAGSLAKNNHSAPLQEAVQSSSDAADGDYRQPVELVFVDQTTAIVPTRLTGELFELQLAADDVQRSRLECVLRNPQRSWGAALMVAPGLLAIVDRRAEQVVLVERSAAGWQEVDKLDAPGPVQALAFDARRQLLMGSGLWSQQLYRWARKLDTPEAPGSWQALPPVELGMCGGELLWLPKHALLLITDAFGSHYRFVDCQTGAIVKQAQVYGHNITALASTRDESMILFPHQLLSETAQSVRNEITWGGVMSNNLRWLRIDRMLAQHGHDIMRQGRFYPLGTNGDGCGDPSSLDIAADGLMAITLAGTNRVALGREDDYYFRQLDVGLHPVRCRFTPDQRALVVVNQFSDSLSVVRLADDHVVQLSLGTLRPPSAAERGEQAFFDATLAHDGWMSCHSCHSQGHTSGQLNDNFTDHSFGTPKRILSLLGQSETAPYSWNGNLESLESQIVHSIESTMASDWPVDAAAVADIAAYVRSLPAPPSLHVARITPSQRVEVNPAELNHAQARPSANRSAGGPDSLSTLVDRGAQLFEQLSCTDCHRGRWLTSAESYDVGLSDQAQQRYFNPPSLIAVSQRQNTLLHDGSVSSLRQLLIQHPQPFSRATTDDELSALVAYLESL